MTTQEIIEEALQEFRDAYAGIISNEAIEKSAEWHRQKLEAVLTRQREEIVKILEETKPDERKVATFGEWQAETYDEKMLVRAMIDALIRKIKEV